MSSIRWTIAGLVLGLALAACSEDPEPQVEPTTPSATPTTSGSPSSSESPSAKPLGPKATVKAWIKARNQALKDGDTSAAEDLGADKCKTCEDSLDPIRRVYADGGHFETDGWRVAGSKVKSSSGSRAQVDTALVYAGGRTVTESGAEPVEYKSEKHIAIFRLISDAGVWRVRFIGYLS